MAAQRTLLWLKSGKTANESHCPRPTSTDSKYSATSSSRDSIELIPAGIPTNSNVGRSSSLLDTISSALERQPQAAPNEVKPCRTYVRSIVRRSASSELLKIGNLENYMAACTEYRRGVEEEWTQDRLLTMIARWRALDEENRRK